jgi:predicted CopG family antitoxin
MKTITLEVSDPTAEKVAQMSLAEKKSVAQTLELLVGRRKRNLEEIMNDASDQAKKNGLTPEILDEILKEIKEERNK